jgi:hypothetical protein
MRRTQRLAILAAGVVVAVAGVVVLPSLVRDRDGAPPRLPSAELRAGALVDSIAVVVHFQYVDTAYGRAGEIVQRLRELGVRHLRDGMPTPGGPLAAALHAAHRAGIRPTLGTWDVAQDPDRTVGDSVRVLPATAIDGFEAPNELDNSGRTDWAAALRTYMPALARAVARHAPGVDVIGPSLVHEESRRLLPHDLPGLVNVHPYPGGEAPEPTLGAALRNLPAGAIRRGVVFTETGYHNATLATENQPPASEEAAAVYLPRLLLSAFGAGVRRTFVYQLVDEKPDPALADAEQHFGLLRNDLSPKPAFRAIRTLIAAVRASPGPADRGPLPWELRGGTREVQRLTLARRDGSRVIALWRPVSVWDTTARRPVDPGSVRVELLFPQGVRDVSVWRPSVSAGPVLRRDAARRLPLRLAADAVLVSAR